MSRRSIAGKRPYRDHYNVIGHYNDDEAYEQDMDVWKGKRKAVDNYINSFLNYAPTSSAPRSAPTSSASRSASTSSAPRTTPTSSAQRTAAAWSAPNRSLASTSSSPARPPTRHKKGEDIDIIKSSESQKTENVENNQVQQDRSTKNYSYSSQEKSLADLKERHIILQKRNDTIQQSIEKSSKKVILHRAEHITESDEDDSDSDVTFIKNIAEHTRESNEDSDDLALASWHPNIISNRDVHRNMVDTSTEADGDDLDFSLDEENNIPDFDETVRNVPEVGKESSTKTLSRTDLEKMLNAERLKNQMLQTELDQVQRDRSTKNYSYLSQQKSLTDLKEKNLSLQKKLDKTQEEISAQTEVILEKMETIDNLQKNSTEQSYLAICRENVNLKRSNKELEGINAVLSPAAKEIRKIRNSLIAKIQLGSRETDENEHENMLKLDILSLFQKYEKSVALHEKKLTTSCTQKDEMTEKVVSQANLDFRAINEELKLKNAEVEKLKAKIVRLKAKIKEHKNKACTESLTLQKLSELQEAIGTNRNEPDKIKALEDKLKDANETLLNCKTKLDLQKEMSRMYQKQQQQMMDILQIPQEDRSFAKVLNAVTAFQEAKAGIFTNTEEQNEIDLYENAERILQD